jgi:hypothetical protein
MKESRNYDIRIQFEIHTTWAADKISLKKAIKCVYLMETFVDILWKGKICTKTGTYKSLCDIARNPSMFHVIIITHH